MTKETATVKASKEKATTVPVRVSPPLPLTPPPPGKGALKLSAHPEGAESLP